MNRRELIRQIALLTGTALVGGEFFLTGCRSDSKEVKAMFSESDIAFLDEIAETVLPRTNTPGAKDAAVGAFMAKYVADCYSEKNIAIFKGGLQKVDEASGQLYSNTFMKSSATEKEAILSRIDAEAKRYQETANGQKGEVPPHYFTLMKQLVLLGFFTSKPGATQVLHYVPVPGKYEGCIDYKQGDTAWA